MSDRPNILLVMTDQQRADTLSCLGSPWVRTPHFDALAARGVLFERAFSPVPLCSPARASLWTGLHMHRHNIVGNVGGVPSALDIMKAETVFADARRAGYRLAYIGKWHLGEADPGLFDVWEGYNSRKPHWVERDGERTYRPFLETARAIELLETLDRGRPFFMVVSHYPPHPPYDPPPGYADGLERTPLPEYFGAVRAIDDCIGRLAAALDARGLWDRTAVLFCSDHAQVIAPREARRRKRNLFDETVRIPMILTLPGGAAAGRRSAALVGLIDAAPTIRTLIGAPPGAERHGESLTALVDGDGAPWRESILLQNRTAADQDASGRMRDERALRTTEAKLIVAHGRRPQYYRLADDPDERNDLLAAPSPPIREAAALCRALERQAAAMGDAMGVHLARTSFRPAA